jgi:Xaa-Pro aminopeptidase
VIDEQGYASHCEAARIVDRIRAEAFAKISEGVRAGNGVSEFGVTRYIMDRFTQEGLTTADAPIVGSNEHPADPHFESTPGNDRPFKTGDTVLIDLWAKKNAPGAIYYDITWVGYIGDAPSPKYQELFATVVRARDAAVALVKEKFARKQPCYGWQLDDAARRVITKAGYGKYFVHRTGHSIGEETHGNGGNIDNLETRDDRLLMPGCCFSIEPGIYLEGAMAVRSEVNVFIRHDGVPEVTGEVQQELVKM